MYTPNHPPRIYRFRAGDKAATIRTAYGFGTAESLAAKELGSPVVVESCYCPIKGQMRIVNGFPMNP